jgi:GNAT superfamily N-acetyltransferase
MGQHGTTIRPLQHADVDVCRQIFFDARREAFDWVDSSWFAVDDFDAQTYQEQVWVAEASSGVVGFIAVHLPSNYIHHLFVAPAHQGLGVGTKLLHFALQRLSAPVDLKCLSANVRACRFYKERGWRGVERAIDEVLGAFVRYRWEGSTPLSAGDRNR